MDIYGNEVYNINQTLKEMTDIQRGILDVIGKQESLFTKVLKYIVLIAGALTILNTFELVRIWIFGG